MRDVGNEVLAHFLEVLAIAYKLTTGHRGKVKLAFKVSIFGEDEGIRSGLRKLETIISEVTSLEIPVIANELSEAAKNIVNVEKKVNQIAEASEVTVTKLGQLATAEDRRSEVESEKKETEAKASVRMREPWRRMIFWG